jgi:hypothetical protein
MRRPWSTNSTSLLSPQSSAWSSRGMLPSYYLPTSHLLSSRSYQEQPNTCEYLFAVCSHPSSCTNRYFFPQLLQQLHTLIVDVNTNIMATGKFRGLCFWPHRHKTIPKQFVIRNSKGLEDEKLSAVSTAHREPTSRLPDHHKLQTGQRCAVLPLA